MKIHRLFLTLLILQGCAGYNARIKTGDLYIQRAMFLKGERAYKDAILKDPERPEALIKLSRLYLKNRRHGEALLLLQRSLALKPASPWSWSLLASYYSNRGELERASFYAEAGIARFPENRELLNQREQISLALFITRCNAILAEQPDAAIIRKMLGFRLMKENLTYLALSHFDRLAEKEPGNKKLFRMLAALFLKKGNTARAKSYLHKLLKADHKDSYALAELGKIELNAGYPFKAYRHFFNNARYHPTNGEAFETVGYLTLRMAKKNKALEYLEQAHLLGRRSSKLFASIGYLHASRASKESRNKGRRFLELAGKEDQKLRSSPAQHRDAVTRNRITRLKQFQLFFSGNRKKEAEICYRLALQYRKLEKNETAYNHLLRAYRFYPDEPSYLYLKAELELKLGRYGDIRRSIAKLDRIAPFSARLYKLKCNLYREGPLKSAPQYLKTLQSAASRIPGNPCFHLQLAGWHKKAGDLDAALSAFRHAAAAGASVSEQISALTKSILLQKLQKEVQGSSDTDKALTLALKIKKTAGLHSAEYRKALGRILSLAPRSAGAHTLMGETLAAAFFKEMAYGHLQKACFHLKKALKLYPGHSRASRTLTRLLSFDHKGFLSLTSRLNRIQQSNALLPPAVVKNQSCLLQKYPDILANRFFTIGKILFRKNRSPASLSYISRSIRLNARESIDKLLALAQIHRELGNSDRAISAYSELLKQKRLPEFRQYAIIYATLGNLYTRKALTYPYSCKYLKEQYMDSGKKLSSIVSSIQKVLEESKRQGKTAFQRYIMRNTLLIQRDMGQKKIRTLLSIPSDREEVYLRIATLMRTENNKAAIAVLRKADSDLKSGKRRRILLTLARDYELTGEREKAEALYRRLSVENKNDWKQVYAQARRELSRGRLEQSLKIFTRAASLNRGALQLRIIIGFLRWRQGRMDLAVKELKSVLAVDEDNINANYYLCKIHSQQGHFEMAEKHGNRVQELFKKNLPRNYLDRNKKEMLLDTIHTLARVALLRGDVLRALKYAYAGSSFDNTDSFHFLSLTGDIFFLQKKYKHAEHHYSRAVHHNPSVPFLRFKLARTYFENGKLFLCKRILKKIFKEMPAFNRRAELMLLLARVRGLNKDQKGEESLLQQLVREFPSQEEGYLALASLYRRQNRFQKQSSILESGLRNIKKAPGIRDAIAWFIIDRGKSLQRALQLAKENVDLMPGNANFRATYGYILFRIKRYRNSRDNLSSRQIAFYRKEDFYKRNDMMENATEYYRVGRFRKAFQLVCYPRPGIYRSRALFADTLFSRLILKRDAFN